MQLFGKTKPPVGVIFDSDMGTRIDNALALALLYGLDGKNEARVVGLSISRVSLAAAQYCEAVGHFYASRTTGPLAKYMRGLTIGLAANGKISGDTPMLTAPLARKGADGAPVYRRSIAKLNDTADPAVLIRNTLTAQHDQNAIVVLAGPATNLAATLDLYGAKELIQRKVRYLVISGGAYPDGRPEFNMKTDIAAARKVFAEWPTPIIASGVDIGSKILFPASSVEKDFAYSDQHPIADAYRAYKSMPYDAPTWDMSAVLHAVRPKEGYFKASEPGVISVTAEGGTRFSPSPDGRHQYLILPPDQHERIIKTYTEIASAQPVERYLNFRKKEEKEEKQPPASDPDAPREKPDEHAPDRVAAN
jgi:inosine-uridine nucleoside N-ribohydrolase